MASTTFQDYNQNTPVTSAWLNDVNGVAYTPAGTKKVAAQSAAAWVRFNLVAGVVTIQQSSNISSIVRTGVGVYVITYGTAMTEVPNSYGLNMNVPGFCLPTAETANSVTVTFENTSGVAFDPAAGVSFQLFGAN